ncbi:hypothetical protein F5Y11DRAFT_237946 [Daldinia sp. FL1419]|nr:hypothetical protein F5Y11DRAFT_237946 [Daldinia sp. FL1419]
MMMHQGRICHWLGLERCTHDRTFLDLPAPVRRRIYDYAGLFSGQQVYLRSLKQPHESLETTNHSARRFQGDVCDWCDILHFTFNLLQTCKAVYVEVSTIIYSENFILVPQDALDDGLRILRNLTPHACNNLTNLYVHLHISKARCSGMHPYYHSFKVSPVRKRLAAWQQAANHVLRHSNPRKLRLHIICDDSEEHGLPGVLEPLRASPGRLKDCALRLHGKRDKRLFEMARQVVETVSLEAPKCPEKPFRFLDLPPELQISILKYTDLVTPANEVRWNTPRGFYFEYVSDEFADEHDHRVLPWCEDYHSELGCFCMRCHSSYSSRCRCWHPPRAFFLVNRAMYDAARTVFYSCNRVIISPLAGILYGRSPLLAGLEACIFVTKFLRPDTLSYLRYLELVCSPFETDEALESLAPPEPQVYDHWQRIIDFLNSYANLPALTIAVYMTRFEPSRFGISDTNGGVTRQVFEEGVIAMEKHKDLALRTYLDILLPFQSLTRIGRFFVFIEWAGRYWLGGTQKLQETKYRLSAMERWLEQRVMGSEYESRALGKENVEPSNWLVIMFAWFRYY